MSGIAIVLIVAAAALAIFLARRARRGFRPSDGGFGTHPESGPGLNADRGGDWGGDGCGGGGGGD